MNAYYTLLFDIEDCVTIDKLEDLLEQFEMLGSVWFDDDGEYLLPSTTVIKAWDQSDGVAVRLIQSIYDCDVNLDTVEVVVSYDLGDDLDDEFFDAHEEASKWCDTSEACFLTNTRYLIFEVPFRRLDEFVESIKQSVRGDYALYVGDIEEEVKGTLLIGPTWCEVSMHTEYTVIFDEDTNLDDFDELMDFFGVYSGEDFHIDEWDEDRLIMEIRDGGDGAGVRLIQSIYDCDIRVHSVEVSLCYDGDDVPDGYHSSGYCSFNGLRGAQYTLDPDEVESFIESVRSMYDKVVIEQ